MAEELAVDEALRQGGAVDADKWPILAGAFPVNGPGDQLLSHAGFTVDENGGYRGSDLGNEAMDPDDDLARADDVAEGTEFLRLFTIVHVLLEQAVVEAGDLVIGLGPVDGNGDLRGQGGEELQAAGADVEGEEAAVLIEGADDVLAEGQRRDDDPAEVDGVGSAHVVLHDVSPGVLRGDADPLDRVAEPLVPEGLLRQVPGGHHVEIPGILSPDEDGRPLRPGEPGEGGDDIGKELLEALLAGQSLSHLDHQIEQAVLFTDVFLGEEREEVPGKDVPGDCFRNLPGLGGIRFGHSPVVRLQEEPGQGDAQLCQLQDGPQLPEGFFDFQKLADFLHRGRAPLDQEDLAMPDDAVQEWIYMVLAEGIEEVEHRLQRHGRPSLAVQHVARLEDMGAVEGMVPARFAEFPEACEMLRRRIEVAFQAGDVRQADTGHHLRHGDALAAGDLQGHVEIGPAVLELADLQEDHSRRGKRHGQERPVLRFFGQLLNGLGDPQPPLGHAHLGIAEGQVEGDQLGEVVRRHRVQFSQGILVSLHGPVQVAPDPGRQGLEL